MSLINLRDRTINAKVVYYGTGLSGKTTSLSQVHQVMDPQQKIDLVALNTEGDRTLFFDFLPIPLGTLNGFQIKLQAFTVPGQVRYNLTRRYVLRGADGVIFVADSSPDAFDQNVDALVNLRDNLIANRLDPQTIPLFIQYNKRDRPDATPLAEMRSALNRRNLPDGETVATAGEGVFEAFSTLCCDLLERIADEYRIGDPSDVREKLWNRLMQLHADWRKERPSGAQTPSAGAGDGMALAGAYLVDPEDSMRSDADDGSSPGVAAVTSPPSPEAHETEPALPPNAALAESLRHLAALQEVSLALAGDSPIETRMDRVLETALRAIGAQAGSVLVVADQGRSLSTGRVRGLAADPIASDAAAAHRVLAKVLRGHSVVLLPGEEPVLANAQPGAARAAVVAPLVRGREVLGAMVAYVPADGAAASRAIAQRLLSAIAAQLALAADTSRLATRVEGFAEELTAAVAERTKELEKTCRDLREQSRKKDGFLATVGQGLLTPMNSITSFAEVLASSSRADPGALAERAEFASIVLRESRRMSETLQTLVDLSRLESGSVRMEATPLDLREQLLASYRRLRAAFKERDIQVRVWETQDMPKGWADPHWLGRIFDVLLSNAIRYSPANSEVHVTLRSADDGVSIEVRDHGPGIAEALRPQLFERLKSTGATPSPEHGSGIGLGLPLARALVERLGGRISCHAAEDGGTVFAFSLPRAQ